HGRVVAAAERLADLDQRDVQQLAHQVHRDLPRHRELLGALLRYEPVDGDAELLRHALADQVRRELDRTTFENAAERFLRQLRRHFAPCQRRVGEELDNGALELAHVRAAVARNERQYLVVERDLVVFRLLAQDRDTRLEIRWLDVRDESPLEARDQALLEPRDLLRRTVARHHDLALRIMQRVERVEELLLRALLLTEEVHVVDQQQVDLAVAPAEVRHAPFLDRRDQIVREPLA